MQSWQSRRYRASVTDEFDISQAGHSWESVLMRRCRDIIETNGRRRTDGRASDDRPRIAFSSFARDGDGGDRPAAPNRVECK